MLQFKTNIGETHNRVSKKSEIFTARFAKIKSQGTQRPIILIIYFAILAKPSRTLR